MSRRRRKFIQLSPRAARAADAGTGDGERYRPVTEQSSADAGAKALAFANGLRKSVLAGARRWSAWPGGSTDIARVIACIEQIQQRARAAANAADATAQVAACVADLRAVLEWSTYQSASITTARALLSARRVRAFAKHLGLIETRTSGLALLADSEESLIEHVRTKNSYMAALAAAHPHLELPPPLIDPGRLAPPVEKPPNRLALIQQLRASAKPKRAKK
jgi:hypothetical protein